MTRVERWSWWVWWLIFFALLVLGAATRAEDIHRFCAVPCGDTTEGMAFYSAVGSGLIWKFEFETTQPEIDGRFCWETDMELLEPGYSLVYIVATAYNSAGESDTEHGIYYGEGYTPQTCP